jgi:phytoene dehydrogenase-like protein
MARRFKSLRVDPLPTYDAVIIGAGIGGLICANWLARAGLRVLLVEQHFMAGGYCSTFKREGFVFDAATHFYPLLGNPATLTGKQLVDLGIPTRWIKMDPVDQFHFPDGSSFSVPADFETYIARLRSEFPQEAPALDRFFALARRVYLFGLLYHFRGTPTAQLEPYSRLSVQDVLDSHFQSPKLKLLLTADTGHWGSTPRQTSFVFDSMLRLAYFIGNYYPEGGSQVFADDLAARFEEAGGHILMSSLVTKIHVSDNTADGVDIETGRPAARRRLRVKAGVVVSNGDLLMTLEKMVGAELLGREYLASITRLRPTLPCSVTHIGLRGIPTEVLEAVQGYHWSSWDPNDVASAAFKIFVPTLFDRAIAPAGGHILIVQKLTQVDFQDIQDWAAHKAWIHAFVSANLERVIPGFSKYVVVSLAASALTSYRYTLNHHGAMLGWELAPDQTATTRPDVTGPIRNLYFVGHWTRPGGGITPVMISARRVAEIITGDREISHPSLIPSTIPSALPVNLPAVSA